VGEAMEQVFADLELQQIFGLAMGEKDNLYAAGFPGGKIYSINRRGEVKEFFDTGQNTIWALCLGSDGEVFAATGDEGQIYKIESSGKGTLLYDSSERAKIWQGIASSGRPFLHLTEPGSGTDVEVSLEANATDSLSNSIIVRNTSGAERFKAGVVATQTGGSLAVLSSTGDTVSLISEPTANARTGLWVGANRVTQARQTGPAAISCTPDATWSANEITCLNDILNRLSTWRTALGTSGHGLVTSP